MKCKIGRFAFVLVQLANIDIGMRDVRVVVVRGMLRKYQEQYQDGWFVSCVKRRAQKEQQRPITTVRDAARRAWLRQLNLPTSRGGGLALSLFLFP